MAKVTGPLHCTEARGTIGKSIIYQHSKHSWMARMFFKPSYTRTFLQDAIRTLFKAGAEKWQAVYKNIIGVFNDLSWDDIYIWEWCQKKKKRGGRCGFMANWMTNQGEKWPFYPIPPEIHIYKAEEKILFYQETMDDLETLTGLEFCFKPTALLAENGRLKIGGWTTGKGIEVVYNTIGLALDGYLHDILIIAHELTHALVMQHGWDYTIYNKEDHETIARECAERVTTGELIPIYTYKGKTLSEIVPFPLCP